MQRLSSCVALIASLALCAACGLFKASQPACIPDGGKPCTESYCGLLRTACAKQARIAKRPNGECDIEVCAQTAATHLRASDQPAELANTLYKCSSRATDCKQQAECFKAIEVAEECTVQRAEVATDITTLLPTQLATSSGNAGVVVLPGDDLNCLRCAFEDNSCARSYPECFTAAPAAAGRSDSCLDYRVCLRSCEQTSGDDALHYAQCVAHACELTDAQGKKYHAHGEQVFHDYRQCMFERCSSCFMPQP